MKTITNRSIKRQLSASLIITAFLLWLLIIIGSFYTIRHEVDELYDGELAQLARVLLTLYASEDIEQRARKNGTVVTSPPFEGNENYERKLLFQVWGNNKTLLVRSSNAPIEPIAAKLEQDQLNQFDTVALFGNQTRVFTLWIPQVPFVVHVGQRLELRTHIAGEILESFYYLILLLLPVLIFFIYRSINKSLKPLNTIAAEITTRTSDNLEPVDLANVPEEIKSITTSLNQLFTRLKNAFARERQFIDDAAHELRTPLAGLKAQAQIALTDKSRVNKSLNRIVTGVDRTSRLANQLLSLSRLDADRQDMSVETIQLAKLIEEICRDLQPAWQAKHLSILQRIDPAICLQTDRDMMYMLLRNLLENAIRYCHPETEIDVTLKQNSPEGMAPHWLTITDSGPGIPAASLDRIYDRFYRDIDTRESGSGLGLAIVRRIAELLDIAVSIDNRMDRSGVIVTLRF